MREIIDGVFELGLGFVNVHLVVTDDGVVLVDTGLPRRAPAIERGLREIRKTIGDVRTVLITHHHVDHIGNVAGIRQRSGAQVVAHAADASVITGATRTEVTGFRPRLAQLLLGTPTPTKIDKLITVDGSEPIPGFTALHTPGHTRGHVSYLLDRNGGVMFAGDTAAGAKGGAVTSGPAAFADDAQEQGRSLAKLATFEFEHAVFGHGPAVSGRAVERFREYAARQ